MTLPTPTQANAPPAAPNDGEAETVPPVVMPVLPEPPPTPDTQPVPPIPAPSLPVIPGYEILAELGRGGMGVVYKARQASLNRIVALKMVLGSGFASPEARVRFLIEGEVLGRLQHPHIVQIHEVGTHEGQPFFALEYVEGGSLAERLKEQRFSTVAAAELVATVARAVQYAHGNGVIHRDLKPANILLADKEKRDFVSLSPKVTDFGLAKQMEAGTRLTVSGAVMGTPAYMAPEQAEGKVKAITPATDVYALGAILYELLAGRPPFVAESPLDVIVKVANQEPTPISSLQPKLPRDLATICHKCLAKEPSRRYPTAEALAGDLRRFLDGKPITARPVSAAERLWKGMKRRPAVAALLGSLVLVVATGLPSLTLLYFHAEDRSAEADRLRNVADERRGEADRRRRAATDEREKTRDLLLRQYAANAVRHMDQGELPGVMLLSAEALKHTGGDPAKEWEHRLRLGSLLGSTPRLLGVWQTLYREDGEERPGFTPDGQQFLLVSKEGASLVDVGTGRRCTPFLGAGVEKAGLSPNGRLVATVDQGGGIQLWEAATGNRLSPTIALDSSPAFLFRHDSRALAAWNSQGQFQQWSVPDGKPLHPPMAVAAVKESKARILYSLDGKQLLVLQADDDAKVVKARLWEPLRMTPLTSERQFPGLLKSVAFDRRQRALLLAAEGNERAARVWDAATGQAVSPPLRLGDAQLLGGEFSPDGTLLLLRSFKAAQVFDVNSGLPLSAAMEQADGASHVVFGPEGKEIVTAGTDRTARLWEGATGKPLGSPLRHASTVEHVAFSPDGRRLLSASADGIVRLWDRHGHRLGDSLHHPWKVRWGCFSPQGRHLLTVSDAGAVCLWDLTRQDLVSQPAIHAEGLTGAVLFPGAGSVAAWNHGRLLLGTLPAGQWEAVGLEPGTETNHVLASPDRTRLLLVENWSPGNFTENRQAALHLLERPANRSRKLVQLPKGAIRGACFNASGNRVAAVVENLESRETALQLWDAMLGQPIVLPSGSPRQDPPDRACFSPDGRWLFGWNRARGTAHVWEAATGQYRQTMPSLSGIPTLLSTDGTLLFTCPGDEGARSGTNNLWRLQGLTLRKIWEWGQTRPVNCADFSRDQQFLATGTYDQSALRSRVRVWAVADGLPASPPMALAGAVERVVLDPSGKMLLTVSAETRTVQLHQLWDASTGQPLTVPVAMPESLAATFSPDGKEVWLVCRNGTWKRWPLTLFQGSALEATHHVQARTGHRLDQTGSVAPLTDEQWQEALAAARKR